MNFAICKMAGKIDFCKRCTQASPFDYTQRLPCPGKIPIDFITKFEAILGYEDSKYTLTFNGKKLALKNIIVREEAMKGIGKNVVCWVRENWIEVYRLSQY